MVQWLGFVSNAICGVVGCVVGALATKCSVEMISTVLGYSVSIILIISVAFIFNQWISKVGSKLLKNEQ